MLMIRPDNPNFVFPAGRYGLVIKGQAYDFTVAGPVTEPAQCPEGCEGGKRHVLFRMPPAKRKAAIICLPRLSRFGHD
jgi:hypothetical protein